MKDYDFLIVGQGLAGSALALALFSRGKSVAVIDRQDPRAATRVAAGLVTTLAGKGMNPAWRQAEYLPKAIAYYRALEVESDRQLFYDLPVLRLFTNEKEHAKFHRKKDVVEQWVGTSDAKIDSTQLHGDHGGFEMARGGRLATRAYLDVVRSKIVESGAYFESDFSENDLRISEHGVQWQDLSAEKVIYCQGYAGLAIGRFSDIPHRSAKGAMLTVKVEELDSARILNRNGWMVPIREKLWRAGATYEWGDLSTNPSEEEKLAVEKKVEDLTSCGFTTVKCEVGVRPIIHRSQPVIGLDPSCKRIGFFNGLGSKGVITSPSVGEHFAAYLCDEIAELDPELSLSRIRR